MTHYCAVYKLMNRPLIRKKQNLELFYLLLHHPCYSVSDTKQVFRPLMKQVKRIDCGNSTS